MPQSHTRAAIKEERTFQGYRLPSRQQKDSEQYAEGLRNLNQHG